MDEQTKQVITNAMKQLSNEDPSIRIDGVRKLGEIGVDHPKIIERLQSIASDDISSNTKEAAKNSLDYSKAGQLIMKSKKILIPKIALL